MADTDGDGITDDAERLIGTDPADKDTDNDGLMDGAELKLWTNPTNHDSDGDGFADGSEVAQRRNPTNPDAPHPHGQRDTAYQPTAADPDADRLDDMQERMTGTNPNDPDTDGDGIGDWVEGIRGTNPTGRFTDGSRDASTDLDDVNTEMYTRRSVFLDHARAQLGDRYQFGAETTPGQENPGAFDSSELVQWAAGRAGVEMPDGSWNQYKHLHQMGNTVSVKDALQTPGALVFGFSSDPLATSGRPTRAYVGISTGNGTVIDVSERTGRVSELDPGNYYTHAAVMPSFEDGLDSDSDGVNDRDERLNNGDPNNPAVTPPQAQPAVTPTSRDDTTPAYGGDAVAQAAEPSNGSADLLQSGAVMSATAGTHLASDVLSSDGANAAMTAPSTMQLAVDRTELTDPFNDGAAQTTTTPAGDVQASAESTGAQDGEQEALLDDTMPGEGTAADTAPAEETSSSSDGGSYADTSSTSDDGASYGDTTPAASYDSGSYPDTSSAASYDSGSYADTTPAASYDSGSYADTSSTYDDGGSYGDSDSSSSYDDAGSYAETSSTSDDGGSYSEITASTTSDDESYSYSE